MVVSVIGPLVLVLVAIATTAEPIPTPLDPCAVIAGKEWISPLEARQCMYSFPVVPKIKDNIIDAVNKTIAMHASANYQISAPKPFDKDVHEDLLKDLARIQEQEYNSEFAFHLDLSDTFRRLKDGHCVVINRCYDSFYVSYLPTPLVLLTGSDGQQNVHIAPEAFAVASAEFGDEIAFWQNALPGELKGHLASLSGAQVLSIDDQDPFVAVNANALITGQYQAFGTRQNSFFSSYYRGVTGWFYRMGDFSQHVHPLTDSVKLTIRRMNSVSIDTVTLPYRSRLGSSSKAFTDSASYRARNCLATDFTNGVDLSRTVYSESRTQEAEETLRIAYFQQQQARKYLMNVQVNALPPSEIGLPEVMQPSTPRDGSYQVAQFYLLADKITGVLALGNFSPKKSKDFPELQRSLLRGLMKLKSSGATRLLIDVTNNPGGVICVAHWLHRIIIGPRSTTVPQAGLDTTIRAGPLARHIVQRIVKDGMDPSADLLYNPTRWRNATNDPFTSSTDWLKPLRKLSVNGNEDAFSQRLGPECQFDDINPPPPLKGLFEAKNVVIISNGRCGSSCSLFSVTMSKLEGVRTVVIGGKEDISQQYCGMVGGQTVSFSNLMTEIKTVKLKNHPLAPPDFMANIVQGITWRLGFGIDNPREPEEWQDHLADFNFPLTMEIVNKPKAIWESVSKKVFSNSAPSVQPALVIQESV